MVRVASAMLSMRAAASLPGSPALPGSAGRCSAFWPYEAAGATAISAAQAHIAKLRTTGRTMSLAVGLLADFDRDFSMHLQSGRIVVEDGRGSVFRQWRNSVRLSSGLRA